MIACTKEYRAYICIDCDKKRSSKRYRQDVHCRMGYLFAGAKGRAKEKQWTFDLTDEWLEELYVQQQGKCFYCGLDMSLESGNYSISLDRRERPHKRVYSKQCCFDLLDDKQHEA